MAQGRSKPDAPRRVVLVGAGHAHLYALRRAAELTRRGFELVVVAPEDFWYSGLATGVLAGIYPPALDRIDIAALLHGSSARLVRQAMTGLDPAGRRVLLEDGSAIDFGSLSLNLGSVVPPIPGTNGQTCAAKPVTRLIALRKALEEHFRSAPNIAINVAVAGGGVTGFEIAASVAALASRHGTSVRIVVYAGNGVLPALPPAAADRLVEHLRQRGIDIRKGSRVARVDGSRLVLADHTSEPFDHLVNATGLQPPPLTRALGLATADDGAIMVDDRLMARNADGVFAAGDCIAFGNRPLPKVGVYAIRQAPILFHNLMAFLDGRPLKRFTPQKRYLSIMTLGDGGGLAHRAGLWWRGRAAFLVKDWIDRRFLRSNRPDTTDGRIASPTDAAEPAEQERPTTIKR